METSFALETLFEAGLFARAEGDRLIVQPADRLTEALREIIREHKSGIMESLQREAANCPPTFRRWRIQDPDGQTWDVTRCPPATAAEVAQSWPDGSVLVPVPHEANPSDSPALEAAQEAQIRAWLARIGEHDSAIVAEVLAKARRDPTALAYYLRRAVEVSERPPGPVQCGTCRHAEDADPPHLVRCGVGAPCSNQTGRFWKTDSRGGEQWGQA